MEIILVKLNRYVEVLMPKEAWKCFTANEILLAHYSIHKIAEPLGTIPSSVHFLNKLEEHIGFLFFSCQLILELWRDTLHKCLRPLQHERTHSSHPQPTEPSHDSLPQHPQFDS